MKISYFELIVILLVLYILFIREPSRYAPSLVDPPKTGTLIMKNNPREISPGNFKIDNGTLTSIATCGDIQDVCCMNHLYFPQPNCRLLTLEPKPSMVIRAIVTNFSSTPVTRFLIGDGITADNQFVHCEDVPDIATGSDIKFCGPRSICCTSRGNIVIADDENLLTITYPPSGNLPYPTLYDASGVYRVPTVTKLLMITESINDAPYDLLCACQVLCEFPASEAYFDDSISFIGQNATYIVLTIGKPFLTPGIDPNVKFINDLYCKPILRIAHPNNWKPRGMSVALGWQPREIDYRLPYNNQHNIATTTPMILQTVENYITRTSFRFDLFETGPPFVGHCTGSAYTLPVIDVDINIDYNFEMITGASEAGYVDGTFEEARFNNPTGIVQLDIEGGYAGNDTNLITTYSSKFYVADTGNGAIRQIDFFTRTVSTVYGGTKGQSCKNPTKLAIVSDGLMPWNNNYLVVTTDQGLVSLPVSYLDNL